jgi:hypothetical protein
VARHHAWIVPNREQVTSPPLKNAEQTGTGVRSTIASALPGA